MVKKGNRLQRRSFPEIVRDLIDHAGKNNEYDNRVALAAVEAELYDAINAKRLKIRQLEVLVIALEKRLGKGDMLDPRRKS